MSGLCLGEGELDAVFPFHFSLDAAGRILGAGPALRRLLPEIVDGAPFERVFAVKLPAIAPEFETIRAHGERLFKLEARARDRLVLKGQMLHLPRMERIVFLGSPWPANNGELAELGLSLKDFAVHDSVPDFLLQTYSLKYALNDAQKLAVRLSELNRQLERRVEERTQEVIAANAALTEANHQLQREIAEHKAAEEKIRHLAHFDPLTGLANRTLLRDRLNRALAARRRDRCRLAVLFIDLDRFKPINDTHGHHVGDALLKTVARRLTETVRESDTVSRLGGDEFIVILSDVRDQEGAAAVARKLADGLAKPYQIDGHLLETTPSIGISLYPDHGDDGDTLIRNADSAMYLAKAGGRNNFRFFELDRV